jgi:predicted porin
MKKLLYGTTALVAAGLLSTGAQAADPIKLSVGGYFTGAFFYSEQDDGVGEPAANTRNHYLARESEIIFSGSTTLDNGIRVGVNTQLEGATSADIIDESYIWFEGTWGRFQFGAEDDAAYLLSVGAPKPSNFFFGVASPVFSAVECGTNNLSLFASPTMASGRPDLGGTAGAACFIGAYSPLLTSDREKLTYFSPKFGGFQVGISYTPNNHEEANVNTLGTYNGLFADNGTGVQSEVISIGAQWVGKIMGFDLRVSGGWQGGNLEGNNSTTAIAGLGGLNVFEDRDTYIGAFTVGWGPFSVGGIYYQDDYGLRQNGERRDITLAAIYKVGAWQFGVEYADSEVESGGATAGEDEGKAFALGGMLSLGAGVSLIGEVQFWEIEDNAGAAAAENDATVFLVGTTIYF